ncbi:YihA family ribosome biogenesis GTP-binding protein [Ureaplasma urealyticum]|uniref:Probable GTP-binding protein EngB n=1 Tax=Ureaplasma urealyticum TaxID=2130 RepID=A0AAP9A9X9_UREUR|nr:ribosome biogenesis GTP-binding protein YihA/YsxC [Ureaplasma urealyticum]QDI64835.1 YihA family ribosome biogenesis GTP-binding protein [Ureaplasma urealyticum]
MAKFIKSAQYFDQYPVDKQFEICVIGRSNVGKSSLINALANEKIARTSNTPGRTQLVNFFDFNSFRLVDLPGYGFARVSKDKQLDLATIIDQYLGYRQNLCAVFQICDINVLTNDDVEMSRYFENQNYAHFVVLNKVDKVNKSHFDNNKQKIAKFLNISVDRLLCVSAQKNTNVSTLFALMKKVVIETRQKQLLLKKEEKKSSEEEIK